MKFESKFLSSLEKVFFDLPQAPELTCGSMLKSEMYAFQLAMYILHEKPQRVRCRVEVDSALTPFLQIHRVEYVASQLPAMAWGSDDDYITKTPGLFPDPLCALQEQQYFELANGQARALWFTVEPKGACCGEHPITVRIYDHQDQLLTEKTFTLQIIDAQLPPLDIYNTGWLHGDCLSVLHDTPIGTPEYDALLETYLQTYVRFGHNMVLTPIFTLPLNTAVGGQRPTDQMVAVTVTAGKYRFGFDRLKAWIDLCHRYGIRYFEMGHLFTQWGAHHAPKIMACVDGEEKQIFGWDTDASGAEYKAFLDAFLPALTAFLEAEGVLEDCFFHVSDEPNESHLASYAAARRLLQPYIREDRIIDALSSYEFYEKGLVRVPVVTTDHIATFLENGVEDLWAYYCVAQRRDVANRFMAQPSYRNRILGIQLYKSGVKGFLHWGFNFWFTGRSERAVDPYRDTACGGYYPSGDGYVVYPMDDAGNVPVSLRLHVFCHAMQDYRALKLLESLTDRQTVLALLTDTEGFDRYPRNSQYLLQLRSKINTMIDKSMRKGD